MYPCTTAHIWVIPESVSKVNGKEQNFQCTLQLFVFMNGRLIILWSSHCPVCKKVNNWIVLREVSILVMSWHFTDIRTGGRANRFATKPNSVCGSAIGWLWDKQLTVYTHSCWHQSSDWLIVKFIMRLQVSARDNNMGLWQGCDNKTAFEFSAFSSNYCNN